MRARHFGFGVALVIAALAAAVASPPARAASHEEVCLQLFQAYDQATRFGASSGSRDDRVISRNAEPRAQRLMEVGCITREGDLNFAPRHPDDVAVRTGATGVSIAPIWLHVGIVPGVVTEIEARSFFGALDIGVRGIGAPTLGRRIFVGPFTDAGALAEAAEIARRAGFVAPYPRRFGV